MQKFEITQVYYAEGELIQEKQFIAPNGNSYNCLLGMDVLGKGILVYDGRIQEALHIHIE